MEEYLTALEFWESSDFDEALEILDKMDQDNEYVLELRGKCLETKYLIAVSNWRYQRYELALKQFESIREYKDSEDYIKKINDLDKQQAAAKAEAQNAVSLAELLTWLNGNWSGDGIYWKAVTFTKLSDIPPSVPHVLLRYLQSASWNPYSLPSITSSRQLPLFVPFLSWRFSFFLLTSNKRILKLQKFSSKITISNV